MKKTNILNVYTETKNIYVGLQNGKLYADFEWVNSIDSSLEVIYKLKVTNITIKHKNFNDFEFRYFIELPNNDFLFEFDNTTNKGKEELYNALYEKRKELENYIVKD